jgi:hypothetical protein
LIVCYVACITICTCIRTNMCSDTEERPVDNSSNLQWRKSKRSGKLGNCVEVACLPEGGVAMRNSRFPDGAVLTYTQAEMAAFLAGVKDGEFDDVLG